MKLEAYRNKSRIILAIDFIGDNLSKRLDEIIEKIAAVKIGLPMLLSKKGSLVLNMLAESGAYIIADLKLADIPKIMVETCKRVAEKTNGIIAHAFIGSQALRELQEYLNEIGIELFLVTAMTHPGAEEFINRHFEEFLVVAKDLADGIVAPATFRKYIVEARKKLKTKLILSPGVGAQGASLGLALESGADFEIIGRAITLSEDPVEEIEKINSIHKKIIEKT